MTLRITARYDNLYPYDTEIYCNSKESTEENNFEYVTKYTALNFNEFLSVTSTNGSECQLKGGYCIAILYEITKWLNIRKIELVNSVSIKDYHLATNKSIDLFVGINNMLRSRAQFVDSTTASIGFSRLNVYLNHDHEANNQDILAAIKLNSWLAVLGMLVLFLSVLLLLSVIGTKWTQSNCAYPGPSELLFEGVGTVLQKGYLLNLTQTKNSTRIVLISISLFTFTFVAAFTSLMTAYVSVRRFQITTPDGLANSNYEVMIHRSQLRNLSTQQEILEKLSDCDTTIKRIVHKAEKSDYKFQTFNKSVSTIQKYPLGWITWDDVAAHAIKSFMNDMPCSWSQFQIISSRYPWVMYMKKNFTYRHEINKLLHKMGETGLLSLQQQRWLPSRSQTDCKQARQPTASITNLISTFLILTIGILLAILALLAEKFFTSLTTTTITKISSQLIREQK